MEFQNRLYELRKKAGLSQEGLADLLGVTRQAVQKWEAGSSRPDMDNLAALARYFNVTLDYLVTGREPEPYAQEVPTTIINHNYYPRWHYEYKSQRTLFGLPLVHVRLGDRGFGVAKGSSPWATWRLGSSPWAASPWDCSAWAGVSLGLLLALGGMSVGGIAIGACAVGLAALGGGHRPAVRGRRLLRRLRSGRRGGGHPDRHRRLRLRSWPSGARPPPALSPSALGPTRRGDSRHPPGRRCSPCMAPGPAHLPRPGSLTLVFPGARGIMVSNLPGWAAPPRGQERPMIPTYEQMGTGWRRSSGNSPTPSLRSWTAASSWRRRPCLTLISPGEMYIMGNTAMICWAGTSSYTTAPLPPCSRRRTRRGGRMSSSPRWLTSSPTTWRRRPAFTPWMTKTPNFSVRPGDLRRHIADGGPADAGPLSDI